ncbi:MAG TPA: DUF4157 domain-containing protein [Kofleriaceae bacterium]|nr:DUF4157 domain-containing protein [Kofleriaceae bacterium]
MSNPTSNEPSADQLTDELARKYDPERLLRMLSRRAGKGEQLDYSIRQKYEKRFGVDLGHVRIYTGEFAEEFNRQRGAYAVTVGSTGMILMGGSPEKSMASASGQALLAHELTHVAQAKKGLHRSATSAGGMPFAQEHEVEAEAVEQSVAQAGGSHDSTTAAAHAASARVAAKEAMNRAIEKIKERVHEMAAEAARHQMLRNGSQRRA